MSKGYWIVRVDIADPEKYKAYLADNAVIEFPSYEAALDCWKSPEYQAAMKLRTPVSTADLVIIEGYEGPQP